MEKKNKDLLLAAGIIGGGLLILRSGALSGLSSEIGPGGGGGGGLGTVTGSPAGGTPGGQNVLLPDPGTGTPGSENVFLPQQPTYKTTTPTGSYTTNFPISQKILDTMNSMTGSPSTSLIKSSNIAPIPGLASAGVKNVYLNQIQGQIPILAKAQPETFQQMMGSVGGNAIVNQSTYKPIPALASAGIKNVVMTTFQPREQVFTPLNLLTPQQLAVFGITSSSGMTAAQAIGRAPVGTNISGLLAQTKSSSSGSYTGGQNYVAPKGVSATQAIGLAPIGSNISQYLAQTKIIK